MTKKQITTKDKSALMRMLLWLLPLAAICGLALPMNADTKPEAGDIWLTPGLFDQIYTNDTIQPTFATHACDLVCPDFQVNWGSNSATCGQNDGYAIVAPTGFPEGTTFNYLWSGGVSTSNSASNLSSGIYSVTVDVAESGNGSFRNCEVTVNVLVDDIGGPEVNVTTKPASCLTQDGKAFINITEGTPPFTISWGDNTVSASSLGQTELTGLAAGAYIFSIKDANGCLTTAKAEVGLDNDSVFDVVLSANNPSACGLSDGTLTVNINGGFPPYTIVLNNIVPVTTNTGSYTFTGLASGSYTVDVTDSYLCSEVDKTADLKVSCPPSVDGWQGVDADCSDGIGYLVYDGGGSPDEYFEIRQVESVFVIETINGATAAVIEVPLGAYKIKRLSNIDDCICEFRIDIKAPPPLEVKVETIDPECGPNGLVDSSGRIEIIEITGGTPPYSVVITAEDGSAVAVSPDFTADNLTAGIYTIRVEDDNDCDPLIFTDSILVAGIVESGLEEEIQLCAGDTYQVNGDANLQYQWSPTTGLSAPDIHNPVITGLSDITYIVTVTDPDADAGACNTIVDTLNVIVEPAVELLILNDTIPCDSFSTVVVVTTSNGADLDSIFWFNESDVLVNEGENFVLTTAEANGEYQVIAEGTNGCVDTAFFELIVESPDTVFFTAFPEDTTICEGNSVTFQATLDPPSDFVAVSWFDQSTNALLETGFELTVSPSVGSHTYIAALNGSCVIPDTAFVSVEVIDEPVPPGLPDTLLKVCVGDTIKYETPNYPLPYQWKDINGNVVADNEPLCVEATQEGTVEYIFMSMSACGMVSDTVSAEVYADGAVVIVPSDTTVCVPVDTVCLTASFAAPECIVWTDLQGNELGTGAQLCVLPPLGQSQYIASVPSLDCIEADTATITVLDEQVPGLPDTLLKVCVGDTIKYETPNYPLPYQWKDINGNVVADNEPLCVEATQEGTVEYIFMSMSACGMVSDTVSAEVYADGAVVIVPSDTTVCVPVDTVCLTASFAAPECIVWTDLQGNELGTGAQLCVLPPLGQSQYIASVPSLDCIESDTATITVLDEQVPGLPDTLLKVCVGDTIKYATPAYPFPYQWKDINGNVVADNEPLCVEATQEGTVEYIFMSMSACGMVSDTVSAEVYADGAVVIVPSDTTICQPVDTICLTASFSAPECIVWTDLQGNELGTGAQLCVLPPLGQSQYIASVPSLDCIEADTATITVIDEPLPPGIPDTLLKVCVGDTIKYETPNYPLPYQWKDINGNVVADNEPLCVEATQEGTVQYVFMSMSACGMVSDTISAEVYADGAVVIVPSDTTVCVPVDTVCLTASFSAPECIVWTDLQGNELGTGAQLCVLPPLGQSQYIASVPSLDCIESDTATITVIDEPLPPGIPDTLLKVCVGDTIKYETPNYPLPYQWKDINGNVVADNEPLCVEATQEGTVQYVFMSMSACGMVSDTISAEVYADGAVVIVPSDTTICVPVDTICLTASFSAPECIIWTDLQGNELGTGAQLCVLPLLGQSQYIASVPSLDCIESDTATITVIDEPVPPGIPDTLLKVCVGDTIKYETPNYPLPYQWKDINGNVVADNEPLCVEATQEGTVQYVFMSMSACGMVSDTISAEVYADGAVVIVPSDTTVCVPVDTVCLTASFSAPECIVWTDLQGNELGTGAQLCVLPPLGQSQYIASVPSLDCIESDTATITVIDEPVPPGIPDTLLKVCVGDTIKYETPNYPLPYQWKDINGNVVADNEPLCVEATQEGTVQYVFMSMSACGMVSDTVSAEVYADGAVVIVPSDTTVCVPVDTICLTASFAAPECIVWTDLQGNELGTGAQLCVLPPLGQSQYIASVPSLDCIEADTATITVIDEPVPPGIPDTLLKVCVGDTIKYETPNYPLPYQWKDINGNVVADNEPLCVEATQEGTVEYIFMSMSACGMVSDTISAEVYADGAVVIVPSDTTVCVPVDTICLTASFSAPECIVWTDLQGNELGTGAQLCVLPPLGQSQYIASVPSLDCIESDTATITVIDEPVPPGIPDTLLKVCVGDTIKYETPNYPLPYQWKDINGNVVADNEPLCVEATQEGTVQYVFMSMSACGMVSDTISAEVYADGAVVIVPSDTTICVPVDTICLTASFSAPECIIWTDLQGNELGTGAQLCVLPLLGQSQYIASVPSLDCIESDTATITVIDEPVPPGIPDTLLKVCVGDTIKYETPNYPLPYQWKDINGNVVADNEPLCVEATQEGTVQYVFMSMSACGMVSDTISAEVYADGAVVIVPSDTTVCVPVDTVCLTASFSAPECIVWTDLQGNELGTGAQLCVLPPLGQSQYIASVPSLDCIESDTATITVIDEPVPPGIPDTLLKVCVGDTIKYETPNYPLPYQWKDINGNVVADNEPLCVEATQEGTVQYVFMSMSACGMVSDTVSAEVYADGAVVIVPSDTTVCVPVDTICLTASFAAPECIVWTDLQGNELGTGAQLCVLPPLGQSQYIASVPSLDCIESDTATITVIDEPVPPGIPDTLLKVCVGDTIKYETPNYPLPYQWKDINGNVVADNEPLCVEATQEGTVEYIFMSMSACGMVSDTISAEVYADGAVVIVPSDTTVCVPVDTICLTASFSAPECIVWTDLQGNELGTGAQLCVLPPLGQSQYIASVPSLDCIESDTATITVIDEPVPPGIPDTLLKVCVGDTIKYETPNYPLPYQWKDINGNVVADNEPLCVEATQEGTVQYVFMSMSACGMVSDTISAEVYADGAVVIVPSDTTVCVPVDTICLTASFSAPECIVWTDLQGNELGTGAQLCVLPPLGQSQYIASVPSLDCIESDTATITVIDEPVPPGIPDTLLKVCVGDTIKYETPNYPLPYQWKDINGNVVADNEPLCVEATTPGMVTYIFMSMNACGMVSDTISAMVFEGGQVEIQPDSTIQLCAPVDTVCLSASFSAPECIVWTDLQGNELGTGAQLCVLPPLGESQYIASVPSLDCIESDTAIILVIPVDLDVDIALDNAIICEDGLAELIAQVDPPWTGHETEWYEDGILIDMGTDTLIVNPPVGTYEYTAVSSNICTSDTATATLTVQSLDLSITATLDTICEGEITTLEVSGCADCTYEWSPSGTLTDPNAAITDASPEVTTEYTVVVSDGICTDTLAITIFVRPEAQCACPENFFVATAFTPDGDGTNDQACLRSEFLNSYDKIIFMVYNRWGEPMESIEWERQGPDDAPGYLDFCWDGTHRGEQLPPDVYGYYVELTCPDGKVIKSKGNITLLR